MSAWQGAAVAAAAVVLGCTETPLDLRLSPGDDDFGSVALGTTSAPHLFNFLNAGPEATRPLVVELGTEFALATDECSGKSIALGAVCGLVVTFTPADKTPNTDTLVVRSGASQAMTHLRGEGVDPAALRVTPSTDPHDWGAVIAGGPGQTAVFLVNNDGGSTGAPLAVSLYGPDASMFVLGQDRCSGKSLAAGTNCSFAVTFQPPLGATGSHSATLLMGGGLSLGLVGTALHSAALAWSPPSHDYGTRPVGLDDATGDFDFQLSNQGNLDSSTIAVTTTGDFSVRGNGCGPALVPGASCTVTVRFVPSATGARGGTVVANSGAATALLDGTGQ